MSDTQRESITAGRHARITLRVDRVRCSAHGICAQVLAGKVTPDEWGYPVLVDPHLDEEEFRTASTLCPALALYRD